VLRWKNKQLSAQNEHDGSRAQKALNNIDEIKTKIEKKKEKKTKTSIRRPLDVYKYISIHVIATHKAG
jgi:hypothetical protein